MQTTSLSDTRKIWPALIIFLLVFTLCLLGIVSRPGSFLALFWPANAVLLAVLVRRPQWRRAPAGEWRCWATWRRIC